ncbi:hypothetical protein [Cellulomonas sp. URHE0023]|uniref:DUF7507 domain-containing protein n=1 Tax=Cellulomonas sp. URHE0023 TaxID=1380354 RepID=UPI0004875949|nr:hypothetical protein [Cellulomonas sp. URHE0023]
MALAVALLVAGVATAAPAAADGGTSLIDWTFDSADAPSGYAFVGEACLTAAAPGSEHSCTTPVDPVDNPAPPQGAAPGWLQLTSASTGTSWGGVAGSLLYDYPLPASAGLVVTFDQVQYGGRDGADGISFFLSDGTFGLDDTGAFGGSLGYAQRGAGSDPLTRRIEPGVAAGYLGVGLDAYGNYGNDEEMRGRGCTAPYVSATTGRTPDVVALRGPGQQGVQPAWTDGATYPRVDWVQGYCLLSASPLPGQSLRSGSTLAPEAGTADEMQRRVMVSIAPQPAGSTVGPEVVVSVDFGSGYVEVLRATMPEAAPPTYKFGFGASTGGSSDVHLVRNVHVDTIDPLDELTLVKQVPSGGARSGSYAIGDAIPFEYVVYNTGNRTVSTLDISDPSLDAPATCPKSVLPPDDSTVCTGTHLVTARDLQDVIAATPAGQPLLYSFAATAHGLVDGRPLTSIESAAPVGLASPVGSITTQPTLDDTDGDGLADVGETVHWGYEVVGDPVSDLHDVTIETSTGSVPACGTFDLPAGTTHVCDDPSTRTVTGEDVPVGSVSQTAWARGLTVDGTPATTAASTASVAVEGLAVTGSDPRIGLLAAAAILLGAAAVTVSRRRRA